MRIVLIGTVKFSLDALTTLIHSGYTIVAVITKEQSSFNADFEDLTPLCLLHDIPYKFVNDINHKNNVSFIASFKPDIIYCLGWSGLLKKEILDLAPKGVVGYHPAYLPNNRGRHPIIWALVLGLSNTASTFFLMDEFADTGDIISQEIVIIEYHDTAATLYAKLTSIALKQISEFSLQILNNTLFVRKQLATEGNNWRKRGRADGEIDFRMSSVAIYNLVRGLSKPYIGAHLTLADGREIKVWEVKEGTCHKDNLEPGKVLTLVANEIEVKCYGGSVILIDHEFMEMPKEGSYI